ncbi:hypothetical protein [Kineococcus arenarius]|uniref:hypothetical protein n=1 Tax=Kineococcus sp. SYSU DK007 TaxID=3383128 RepID=UPI003D7E4280
MTVADDTHPAPRSRAAAQAALTPALMGTGNLTTLRQEFQAQVPPRVPLDPDLVVLASGIVELALGGMLLTWRQPAHAGTGATTAAFFVAVFPATSHDC